MSNFKVLHYKVLKCWSTECQPSKCCTSTFRVLKCCIAKYSITVLQSSKCSSSKHWTSECCTSKYRTSNYRTSKCCTSECCTSNSCTSNSCTSNSCTSNSSPAGHFHRRGTNRTACPRVAQAAAGWRGVLCGMCPVRRGELQGCMPVVQRHGCLKCKDMNA